MCGVGGGGLMVHRDFEGGVGGVGRMQRKKLLFYSPVNLVCCTGQHGTTSNTGHREKKVLAKKPYKIQSDRAKYLLKKEKKERKMKRDGERERIPCTTKRDFNHNDVIVKGQDLRPSCMGLSLIIANPTSEDIVSRFGLAARR